MKKYTKRLIALSLSLLMAMSVMAQGISGKGLVAKAAEIEDAAVISESDADYGAQEVYEAPAESEAAEIGQTEEDVLPDVPVPEIAVEETEPANAMGYIPDHHILTDDGTKGGDGLLYGTLPASYSSVSNGYITSVKDQNPYGCCWAFSTINCIESSLLMESKSSTPDFSELHLAYFTYNRPTDPLGLTAGDKVTTSFSGNGGMLSSGGNYGTAMNHLATGAGPVNDSVLPYSSASSSPSFASSLAYADRAATLENVFEISAGNAAKIKQMVMNYGSVGMSYYDSSSYLNSSTKAYYNNTVETTNHAVSIVGWDDSYSKSNFSTQPSSNGAWLIKNSWGTGWGNNGYFWISYEDKAFKKRSDNTYNSCYAFDYTRDVDSTEYNYQYDGGGLTSGLSFSGINSVSVANVFTAKRTEYIKKVSVVTYKENHNYSIQIYKNPTSGNPSSGTAMLKSPLTGTFTDAGFHTVEVPSLPRFVTGDKFAVVVTLSTTSGTTYFAIDTPNYSAGSISFVSKASSGQSYYKAQGAGSWSDMASSGYNNRIKAFTTLDAPSLTITYNANGGSGAPAAQSKTWGVNATLSTTEPYKSGYSFVGWNTAADGTGASYDAGGVYAEDENITLYAVYKKVTATGTVSGGTWYLDNTGALEIKASGTLSGLNLSSYSSQIKNVNISSGVTTIGSSSFAGLTALTSVTIPAGVTTIDNFAFKGCTSLTNVTLPSTVKTLGASVFEGCTSLKSISIPSGVTQITSSAFKDCTSLTSVTIPTTVTIIGAAAFKNCSKLTAVTIPANVKEIGANAFENCALITTVTIPAATTSIDDNAFDGCSKLAEINVNASNATYASVSGVLYNKAKTILYRCPEYKSGYITLPATLTQIYTGSFKNCSRVTGLGITKGLTTVGANAFSGCSALATVDYSGRQEHWNTITIGSGNAYLTSAKINVDQVVSLTAPVVTVSAYSKTAVKLTWDSVAGADSYVVERASYADGPWTVSGTATTNSYVQTGLTFGYKYYFRVKAVHADIKSAYSTVTGFTVVLTAPSTVKAARASISSIKVTWSAVSGASGYYVYRSTDGGVTYKNIKTLGSSARSFTDTKLSSGKVYYYKVAAYGLKGKTKVACTQSVAVSAKPYPNTPKIKSVARSSNYKLIVKWAASSGASGYRVYRSVNGGEYTLLKSLGSKARSYTDTSVVPGVTYRYKVCAYKGAGTSGFSSVKSATTKLLTPGSFAAKKSASGSIKLSWKKVAGASGYAVYRYDASTSAYECVAMVAGNSKVSYTDSGLVPGTSYSYKIRAYRTAGGLTGYSSYTSVKSAKA